MLCIADGLDLVEEMVPFQPEKMDGGISEKGLIMRLLMPITRA